MDIFIQRTLIVALLFLVACTRQPVAPPALQTGAVGAASAVPPLKEAEPAPSKEPVSPAANPDLAAAPPSMTASPAEDDAAALDGSAAQLLVKILGNLAYSGLFPDQSIQLTDGYAAYGDGGPGKPSVRLVDHLVVTGNLDGDGEPDAAFLLEDDADGTGRFTYLVVVQNVWTKPEPLEALMLGDRIGVKTLSLDGSQVIVEMVTQGPGDPDCCASLNARMAYSLAGDHLVEDSRTALNRISLADLNGTQWRLVELRSGQPVVPGSEISLQFKDGQASGFAGCNRYHGPVSSSDIGLNSLQVGLVAATKKACPEAIANQEAAYLAGLERASSWRYDGGYLKLVYSLDKDSLEEFVFEPV
jgi:heat shock protein HslJ